MPAGALETLHVTVHVRAAVGVWACDAFQAVGAVGAGGGAGEGGESVEGGGGGVGAVGVWASSGAIQDHSRLQRNPTALTALTTLTCSSRLESFSGPGSSRWLPAAASGPCREGCQLMLANGPLEILFPCLVSACVLSFLFRLFVCLFCAIKELYEALQEARISAVLKSEDTLA